MIGFIDIYIELKKKVSILEGKKKGIKCYITWGIKVLYIFLLLLVSILLQFFYFIPILFYYTKHKNKIIILFITIKYNYEKWLFLL